MSSRYDNNVKNIDFQTTTCENEKKKHVENMFNRFYGNSDNWLSGLCVVFCVGERERRKPSSTHNNVVSCAAQGR